MPATPPANSTAAHFLPEPTADVPQTPRHSTRAAAIAPALNACHRRRRQRPGRRPESKSGQRGKDALARSAVKNARYARANQVRRPRPQRAPSTRAVAVADVTVVAARSLALPRSARGHLAYLAPGHGYGGHALDRYIWIHTSEPYIFTQTQTASSPPPTKHRSPFQITFESLPNCHPPQGGNQVE